MSIVGIGIDISRISRFVRLLNKFNPIQLESKMLSGAERIEFQQLADCNKAKYLCVRWTCKEALFKAGIRSKFSEITITKVAGKPVVHLEPFQCMVSISHDGDLVAANAVVIDS